MHLIGAEPDEVTLTKTMSVVGPDMALARGHQGKDSYVYCRQVPGNLTGVEASEGRGSWKDDHDRGQGFSHQPTRFRNWPRQYPGASQDTAKMRTY